MSNAGSVASDADLDLLLLRSAGGDEVAFSRLYDATAPRAFGLSLRVLRDHSQAEEVVQDSYLHVWLRSARFDPARGTARAWILMIVHGRAVSRVRSVEARVGREDRHERGSTARQSPEADETFDAVNASAEAVRVRGALDTLPHAQREAIELAYYRGLTYSEVAARLGVPLGTTKARIRSGLGTLRDLMGER